MEFDTEDQVLLLSYVHTKDIVKTKTEGGGGVHQTQHRPPQTDKMSTLKIEHFLGPNPLNVRIFSCNEQLKKWQSLSVS